MPSFSTTSKERLETCHQDLQIIFEYVIKYFDCSIICGYRDQEAQNKAYDDGFSKVRFPGSKHNFDPSMAIDCVPYPINWGDTDRMMHFAGYVLGISKMLKDYGAIEHDVRWGGDWNMNTELSDNRWNDMPHFELKI